MRPFCAIIPGSRHVDQKGRTWAYFASETGDVVRSHIQALDPEPSVIVRFRSDGRGYLCCDIKINGKRRTKKVHQLVMEAFKGPTPAGYHIDHVNGVKIDNRLDNLQFRPDRENSADCRKTSRKGTPNLNEHQRAAAHILMHEGWTTKPIALAIGASETTVRRLRRQFVPEGQ